MRRHPTTGASAKEISERVKELHFALRNPVGKGPIDADLLRRLAPYANLLLPEQVREFLRSQKAASATHVVVVPHGPLVSFPLEALVIDPLDGGKYLDDICPPLAYAPSLTILAKLEQRGWSREAPQRLLAVGDPTYDRPPAAGVTPSWSTTVPSTEPLWP